MAYRKKGSKSASRRYYRRRYTRRRRYRRKYPKRSGRRFPKSVEVKSVSNQFTFTTNVASGTITIDNVQTNVINFSPGVFSYIGGQNAGANGIPIPQGTSQGQRIGCKIEPLKLRISGCMSLTHAAYNESNTPNFWQVRCIVYQIKGGDARYEPNNANYHQLSMTGNGLIGYADMEKLFMSYYYYNQNYQTVENWKSNNALAKIPLRRGIGGLFKVLYKKTFWVNTQKNPVKQFRFICRTPKRLVYPETTSVNNNQNQPMTICNNAIFVCWFFQPGSFELGAIPTLTLNYNVDLFYSDK